MKFDPSKHRRRSIRLKDYDYTTPGAYFITICTFQRECLLGEITDGIVVMNGSGEIARDEWFKTIQIRTNVQLHRDEFVVMPNHLHGIIWIIEPDVGVTGLGMTGPVIPTRHDTHNNRPKGPKPGSIGAIIGQFKSVATKRINQFLDSPAAPVWQRNYYDHIIRNERELRAIQGYILANPMNWQLDQDNPANLMGNKKDQKG